MDPMPAGQRWIILAAIGIGIDNGSGFGSAFPAEGVPSTTQVKVSWGMWFPGGTDGRTIRQKYTYTVNGRAGAIDDRTFATGFGGGTERWGSLSTWFWVSGDYVFKVELWDLTAPEGEGYSTKEISFKIK